MRLFRSQFLLRIVATVLVVGVGGMLVPPAAARDAEESALRSLLDDEAAFEAALAAAREAGEGAAARDAFVQVYVQAAEGAVAAEVIYQLLDRQSLGLVAPVFPDAVFVPAPLAAPSPTRGAGAAVLSTAAAVPTAVRAALVPPAQPPVPLRHPAERLRQPRAP